MKTFANMKTLSVTNSVSKLRACVISILLLLSTAAGAAPHSYNDVSILTIKTAESGMYRVSHADLLAKGFDLSGLLHKRFALLNDGQPVSLRTKGQDAGNGPTSRFGPGGFIEFYAEAAQSLYNDQRAFTLVYDKRLREQMADDKARFNKNRAAVKEYTFADSIEEDRYYDYLSPSTTDPWHYGQLISFIPNAATTVDFTVSGLVGTSANIDVEVYGIVDIPSDVNDHHVVASVNAVEVGDEQFDGNVAHTVSLSDVPVTEGANQFKLSLRPIAESPFDAVGLNRLLLSYQRTADMAGAGGQLQGVFDGAQAEVSGLVGAAEVYRVEADGAVSYIKRATSDNGVVQFATSIAGEYVVVDSGGFKPAEIEALPEFTPINTGDAEYLVLTHAEFLGAELDTLVQLRSANYQVKVVDVAQIYAQYGNGLPDAAVLQAYINESVAQRGTRFVTIVGSDTYDYKNIGNTGSISFVPTRYVGTPGGQLYVRQTPSDAVYGDVDADGIPDIPVGRLSVRSKAELALVVEKIQDYQAREGYAGRILIAADKEDTGNGISFADDVDAMIAAIPNDWQGSIRADFKAIPDLDGDQVAHDKVIAAINAGVSVTGYIGHSSQTTWSRATPPLFRASDIAGLTNIDKPTLVTQWGCWNAYFVDPSGNNMADLFLVGGENGAVTVLGASTLTTSEGERALGIELNKRMYLEGKTIGEAVIEAKQAFALEHPNASDILLGWQIIGDPAIVINY